MILPISVLVVSLKCTCLPSVRCSRVKDFKDIGKSYLSNTSRRRLNPEDSASTRFTKWSAKSCTVLILLCDFPIWILLTMAIYASMIMGIMKLDSTAETGGLRGGVNLYATYSSKVDKNVDLSLHRIGIPSAVNIDFETTHVSPCFSPACTMYILHVVITKISLVNLTSN